MSEAKNRDHKPSRFLFTTTPHYGHFHPTASVALALKEAGHEVAFAVNKSFCPVVEQAGFRAFPAGCERESDPEFQHLMTRLQQMPPGPESERIIFGQVFFGVNPRLMIPDLLEMCQSWRPDMLIREAGEFGAWIVAEHLGLPQAAVSPAASNVSEAIFLHNASQHLDPLRQHWGLAPDPELASLYRSLKLIFAPPGFDGDQPEGATEATTQALRPTQFDQSGDETLPSWVKDLPAQPTIYVTLGTVANSMPAIYPHILQTIIAGLRDEALNVIVTIGRDKDPADFGPHPSTVHIARYIPQSLLLPYCDVMIMHGGSNSLIAALDRGLPMVMVPLIADQFYNAQRCTALQIGEVVERANLTPTAIREATQKVLHQPHYRENVCKLQTELHALPGLDHAVRLLEQLAVEKKPPVALSVQMWV